jgi:endonuclease/exonuclease/phosphatase family metal-dependent hydrolase
VGAWAVRGRWVRAMVLGAAVLVVVAVFALSGSAQASGYRQTYLQVNLCGNACNDGRLAVVTALERSIRARLPFAVTLNEVCENQYTRLRADLGPYQGRFDPTGPICHDGARYGNAILVRAGGISPAGSWQLPNPAGDETRRLMCVGTQLSGAPPLLVCVTHISNVAGNHAAQIGTVASVLSGLSFDHAVLLGGDFNSDPADPVLDPLYGKCYGSGTGDFQEAGSTGCASRAAVDRPAGLNQATYPHHKFDYLFLSGAHWSAVSAAAADVAGGLSDHEGLWATAAFGT